MKTEMRKYAAIFGFQDHWNVMSVDHPDWLQSTGRGWTKIMNANTVMTLLPPEWSFEEVVNYIIEQGSIPLVEGYE